MSSQQAIHDRIHNCPRKYPLEQRNTQIPSSRPCSLPSHECQATKKVRESSIIDSKRNDTIHCTHEIRNPSVAEAPS